MRLGDDAGNEKDIALVVRELGFFLTFEDQARLTRPVEAYRKGKTTKFFIRNISQCPGGSQKRLLGRDDKTRPVNQRGSSQNFQIHTKESVKTGDSNDVIFLG